MDFDHMKTMKTLLVLAATVAVVGYTAQATPINVTMSLPDGTNSIQIGDVPATDIPGMGLDPTTVFNWLVTDVQTYDANLNKSLPVPVPPIPFSQYDNYPGSNGLINVTAGQYLVVHYGVGSGGTGTGDGGGLVAYYFATTGTYNIPANGYGPNGLGGFSFGVVYNSGTSLPDGGSTMVMLGSVLLAGLFFRRKFRVAYNK